jgi:hypothetical protein
MTSNDDVKKVLMFPSTVLTPGEAKDYVLSAGAYIVALRDRLVRDGPVGHGINVSPILAGMGDLIDQIDGKRKVDDPATRRWKTFLWWMARFHHAACLFAGIRLFNAAYEGGAARLWIIAAVTVLGLCWLPVEPWRKS